MFEQAYEEWMQGQIKGETNHRRREFLDKGLRRGTVDFLRHVWYPTVGNFRDLYPEWEVVDFQSGYRYLDLAYMPGGVKGGIEIQDYGSHARDLDMRRFKDLCWRHSLLSLDSWTFLLVAYMSIVEERQRCRQLVLSFIGKFTAFDVPGELNWLEAEAVRYARRVMRPVVPLELAGHLRICDRHARRILRGLMDKGLLESVGGKERIRRYILCKQGGDSSSLPARAPKVP
jgi:hypothetical protein